jgi:hypothetical protein
VAITGLGFDQEVPHHSTFSKNRHGRFQESKLFEQLFEQIVRQCVEVGLVQGQHVSVDGSFVEANAAKESRIPREQLAEAAQVRHTVRQYLREVEEQNPVEEPVHERIRYRPPWLLKNSPFAPNGQILWDRKCLAIRDRLYVLVST